jgi:hypothetical protein
MIGKKKNIQPSVNTIKPQSSQMLNCSFEKRSGVAKVAPHEQCQPHPLKSCRLRIIERGEKEVYLLIVTAKQRNQRIYKTNILMGGQRTLILILILLF